jgi:hypothetical protein
MAGQQSSVVSLEFYGITSGKGLTDPKVVRELGYMLVKRPFRACGDEAYPSIGTSGRLRPADLKAYILVVL